jgi:PKD repeat protein
MVATANNEEITEQGYDIPLHEKYDFDEDTTEWIEEEMDTPTGSSFKIWETYEGFWADAEKAPGSDGKGNPPPNNPGEEDDLLCWAATCSNMLEYTGWGFTGGMEHGNTDDFFDYYIDHTTDYGSLTEYGIQWWFNGNLPTHTGDWSIEDVAGGDFWSSSYTWTDYTHICWTNTDVMEDLENWLTSGYPCGLGIYPVTPPGGHAITCWGYNYNPAGATPDDYFLGVWVSDSDSHKGEANPDDYLRYFEVDYFDNDTGTTADDYWWMPNYGSGWKIASVVALEPFPGEDRPLADAGGPYQIYEGEYVNFDASGSTDTDTPDGDLEHRWDFNSDGDWGTGWLAASVVSPVIYHDDYSGEAILEVFDGRLRDVDDTIVTVLNFWPDVNAGADQTVDEGETVYFSGSFYDQGVFDTHTYEWDFDDGATDTSSLTPTHSFCDDGTYTVSLTVTDDDGGVGYDALTITVNNVAPTADAGSDKTVDEGQEVSFTGIVNDVGSCDTFTYLWDFGDGDTSTDQNPTHTYGDNGAFIVTFTVTDDDGASDSDTLTVTVNNVAPSASDLGYAWCDENTIRPMIVQNINDPGSDDITITWDWGDGTPTVTSPIYYNNGVSPDPYPSPEINPVVDLMETKEHTYGDNGEFTVTVTITDDDGGIIVVTGTVRVDNVNPVITSQISMELPYPDNEAFILPIVHDLEFTATAYDQGSDDLTFTWDWDDGTADTIIIYYNDGMAPDGLTSPDINPITVTDTVTHTYLELGTYYVTVTVTDDDGGTVISADYEVIVLDIEGAKHDLNNYIQDLPDDAFKGKADKHKNAFDNMFNAIDDMLDDEEYWAMIQHLNNNIKPKCDGEVGGKSSDDWIIDADAQFHICAKIDDLIDYIETYL